jgi:HEPN domain-containing protein
MKADPEEINEWLAKAEEDWRVAEILMKSGEELTLPSMFHLQQMLEKLLKALILKQSNRPPKTHDLLHLANLSKTNDIESLMELGELLNLFAVNGRYPGDLPDIAVSMVNESMNKAQVIREQLLLRILN